MQTRFNVQMSRSQNSASRAYQAPYVQNILNQAQAAVANAQKMVSQYTASPRPYNIQEQGMCNQSGMGKSVQTLTQINLVNCTNVQVGPRNVMHIHADVGGHIQSDSDDEDLLQPQPIDQKKEEALLGSDRQVSDAELQELARHVGSKWRRLARHLDLEDSDIDLAYSEQHTSGLNEVIYQLFCKWKRENIYPTVSAIATALKCSELQHLYKYLCP